MQQLPETAIVTINSIKVNPPIILHCYSPLQQNFTLLKNHSLNTYKTNTSWTKGIKKQITEISAICLKNKV